MDKYSRKESSSTRHRRPYRSRSRSRSRSSDSDSEKPTTRRRNGNERHRKYSSQSDSDDSDYYKSNSHRGVSDQSGKILNAPPPPRISSNISFGFEQRSAGVAQSFAKPVQLKLGAQKKTEPVKKLNVASAFNNESDDEVEEMPAECKMRMRNIGRDTPTSSGPNSFGKTKQGFCDAKKIFEKNLRDASD